MRVQVRVTTLDGSSRSSSTKVGSHAGRAHKLSLLPENPAVSQRCLKFPIAGSCIGAGFNLLSVCVCTCVRVHVHAYVHVKT